MVIGERLRKLREAKGLSQRAIEKRTGLLCCYISRVEKGHTVPSLNTLEKLARAYRIPLWKVFFDGDEKPKPLRLPRGQFEQEGQSRRIELLLARFVGPLARMREGDRNLLLHLAGKVATKHKGLTRREGPR